MSHLTHNSSFQRPVFPDNQLHWNKYNIRNNDNYDNDKLLDYDSRLQAGLVQHIHTYIQ